MNRVAFTLFGKDIYWYGIIIAAALIVGVVLGVREAKRRGFRAEMVLDFMLIAIPICIICARLYYVAFEWEVYAADPLKILYIWEGGLAIYGAVIGGIIAALIFKRWRRVPIGEVMDIAAPSLIIAQAIGRWGNFVNQEAHGAQIVDKAWQWFPAGVNIEGIWYQATFFYEFVWNVIVFILLMIFRKKFKYRGGVFALYIAGYGFGRFWIEGMRTDSLWWGSFRVSQVLSIVLFVCGIAYIVFMSIRKAKAKPYEGIYSRDWTTEQIAEFKANIKSIRAQEKADKAAKKAEAMLTRNDAADDKVKKAEARAARAKQKLEKLEDDIKISEIKSTDAAESGEVSEKEARKAQKAKEKAEKLAAKEGALKAEIDKADEKVKAAEDKAKKADMKAKLAEQDALEKASKAKKAEIKATRAKEKAEASKQEESSEE